VAVVPIVPLAAGAVHRISAWPASGLLVLASGLVEFGKEAADAAGDALVRVGLTFPAAFPGVTGCCPSTQRRSRSRGAYCGVVTNLAQVR
jgi:hypothetical protein